MHTHPFWLRDARDVEWALGVKRRWIVAGFVRKKPGFLQLVLLVMNMCRVLLWAGPLVAVVGCFCAVQYYCMME